MLPSITATSAREIVAVPAVMLDFEKLTFVSALPVLFSSNVIVNDAELCDKEVGTVFGVIVKLAALAIPKIKNAESKTNVINLVLMFCCNFLITLVYKCFV